ncbi:MAG TPA: ParB/RepB/Spo0J family partition protein [Euzebyales bacterium]|nr:ParB/RepB/Spo0J family partition protein [Euzebyales bacterium]
MSRTGGLGRGLEALIPTATAERGGLRTISLDTIEPNPRQPREGFDQQGLAELAQSLQTVGLLQPIIVRERPEGRYQIIAGERRFRAAQLAGFREIRAVVRHTDDDQVLTEALVENIHRVDLNALEEAAAYQQLLDDFAFTHEQLAARLGKSRSAITNTIRLLSLGVELQQQVASGALTPGHARALLAIDDAAIQGEVADRVIADGLSVRATERLIRTLVEQRDAPVPTQEAAPTPYFGLQQRLSDVFATKVRITGTAKRGQVVIDFSGQDDLQRLLGMLEGGVGAGLAQEQPL